MPILSRLTRFMRRLGCMLLFVSASCVWHQSARAQSLSLDVSTMHDGNIFDAYQALPDQITQAQIDASTDWDFDYSNLSLSYNGSLLLFRDLTARNYHVHVLTFNSTFHFETDQDQEEEEEEDSTSQDEDDSSAVAVKPPPTDSSIAAAHSDSLDEFLYLTTSGAAQFDKSEFSQYDNSRLGLSAAWRQPLGRQASIWPSYGLSYHSYPNLGGISNVENRASLLVGASPDSGVWISLAAAFGIKGYTSSSTYTYVVGGPPGQSGEAGHGKGGAGGSAQRTRTVTLNSPAVRQFVLAAEFQDKVAPGIRLTGQARYFGTPSSAARILPQQINGGVDQEGMIGLFTSQNEIFDDHYGYSGSQFVLGVKFSLPLSIELGGGADFISKKYTIPAKDLSDTLVVANNREDNRLDLEIDLSTTFKFGNGSSLKPKTEAHVLRNHSNAPYYEFDKTTFLVGVEYNF